MFTKETVLGHFNVLKDYAVQKYSEIDEPNKEEYEVSSFKSYLDSLEGAINNYFSTDLGTILNEVPNSFYTGFITKGTVCENDYKFNFGYPSEESAPKGYRDLREVLYDFSGFMTITPSDFWDYFVFEEIIPAPPADESSGEISTPEPIYTCVSSEEVEKLTSEFSSAGAKEISAYETLKAYLDNLGNYMKINMYEDRGNVITSLSKQEISDKIYRERGLLEIIQVRGLSTYVPSKYKE